MTKSNWEGTFRNLREQYVRGAEQRLENIAESLEKLRQSPQDAIALEDLKRHFHGLSGSGTTYGYPKVSAIGLEGEQSCQALIKVSGIPSGNDMDGWQNLLDSLRNEFHQIQPMVPAPAEQITTDIARKGARIF